VNLRFYVRRLSKRGVVFVRELVPRRAVAAVARWAFNEHYVHVPMSHQIAFRPNGAVASAEYTWGSGSDRCVAKIETEGASYLAPEGSVSQFITEHYWGYAAQKGSGCLEYEVQHPQWQVWNAKHADFSGNPTRLYGAEFAQILRLPPDSAFLAEGSAVTVSNGTAII
jgi:uncharacterized protein YqjF (DUF2071 family)